LELQKKSINVVLFLIDWGHEEGGGGGIERLTTIFLPRDLIRVRLSINATVEFSL